MTDQVELTLSSTGKSAERRTASALLTLSGAKRGKLTSFSGRSGPRWLWSH